MNKQVYEDVCYVEICLCSIDFPLLLSHADLLIQLSKMYVLETEARDQSITQLVLYAPWGFWIWVCRTAASLLNHKLLFEVMGLFMCEL